jgi:DNA-directed RNA polymerase subunit N
MMIPVRCWSCGKVVASGYDKFVERVEEGDEDPEEVLDDIGLTRYCCRRMIVSHADVIDEAAAYV